VPGHPLDPRAEGPKHLIREGATLVRSASDILESLLHFDGHGLRDIHSLQEDMEMAYEDPARLPENGEVIVLQNLSLTPCGVDELCRSCDMRVEVLQTILLELELAGQIKRYPGNRVGLL
jgi:DNA processing protein